ncbi:MAG: hypothetical protein ACLQVL_35580 [Terriglobia bacterium]
MVTTIVYGRRHTVGGDLTPRVAAWFFLFAVCCLPSTAFPQQPQAQAGQPLYPVNAKYVQGFGPGYWPTAGSNLTLNLAPGTAVCSNVVRTYAGGTLTLAPSATNYVYLNPANNCGPASNTTGFTSPSIPIATVVTSSTAITSITDVRTMFVSSGASGSGTVTSVGMTGDGIIFSPTVSGSPITASGTLVPQLLTQTANTVLAGPGSGLAATPIFRGLVAADLPATISSNTTGNAATAAALASSPVQCGSNNWATGISSSGNANCLQPGFTNLSGSASILQGGTGQTTSAAAFNALSPLTTEGDLLYFHSSANTRLARGSGGQCLTSNGTDPVWGSCGAGSGSTTGLGNGTTVIDVSLQAGADLSAKVNAAIADCSPGPCAFDLRGFTGSQTMSVSIQFPANSDVIMGPMTISMASGTQFLLSNNVHIHGSTSGGFTSLVKVNTTNDYAPVIYGTAATAQGIELDHLWIGPTTSASLPFPVTSVATSSGGNAVYTGTFPSCGSNACAGFEFGVWGFQGTHNEGYYTATASTTTSITLNNSWATAETAPTNMPGGTFAVLSGGWAIAAPFISSHLHDIFSESDMGLKLTDSGCGCYNDFENLTFHSNHGAIYLGLSTASLDARSIVAWATDDNSVPYAAATGYGVRAQWGSSVHFDGLDIENTKYSIVLKTAGFQVDNLYLENDDAVGQGVAAEASLPILMVGTHGVKLPLGMDVVDLSGNSPSLAENFYGTSAAFGAQVPNPVYGSFNLTPTSIGGYSGDAYVGAGSGSTSYDYWMVAVDGNGNKTVPVPYSSVPFNQALGPYTLTLTAASAASGSLTTYTGTITGGNGGGLDNNTFTITGFTNAGNNGTFSCPTTTSTTLVCTNSAGVAEAHSGSAASDAYNVIKVPFIYSGAGIKCFDILKGSTAQSLATCVPPSVFPLHDDGTITLQPYSVPTRNATADAYVPGKLSTSDNVLDDGSGNITAGGKITSGASTSSAASFNTPAGAAPTSPTAGDYWYDGDRVYVKDAETNSGVASSVPRRFTITSAVIASSTSAQTVGTFAVGAGKTYCLMCQLFIQSNNTSNKPTMLVTCPSSPTASQFGFVYLPTATTVAESAANCGATMPTPTATGTASITLGGNSLTGMLQNGSAAGSLTVQVESSGAYNTIIEPGSYCLLY